MSQSARSPAWATRRATGRARSRGPTIENGDGGTLEPIKGSFHQVRIGPDAYGVITLVFHANPKAVCGGGTAAWMDSVDLHFTTLGVFHNTQAVPLGELEAVMASPRSGC